MTIFKAFQCSSSYQVEYLQFNRTVEAVTNISITLVADVHVHMLSKPWTRNSY